MSLFLILLGLALILFLIDTLSRMADERRRLEEDAERTRRIAAGRARAQAEYERRERAAREGRGR